MNPDSNKRSSALSEENTPDAAPTPPLARGEPVEQIVHGDRRVDHDAWLRQKGSPEVLAYLEAENAYTDVVLKPTPDLQRKLYQEMLGRILETDLSVPYRLRGYLYFSKTVEGKQYPYHYRRRDAIRPIAQDGEAPELLLDVNQRAAGHALHRPSPRDAGRMKQKQNTFGDFIAAAEHLVRERYTSRQKLAIQGGSAGGLLMGAVCNQRPELFRAVLSQVPFVDVLNTMLDAGLPLTVGEYEWGNPQISEDYFRVKKYCPYAHLERKAYPAMLSENRAQ